VAAACGCLLRAAEEQQFWHDHNNNNTQIAGQQAHHTMKIEVREILISHPLLQYQI
jgi:hypothetical protein